MEYPVACLTKSASARVTVPSRPSATAILLLTSPTIAGDESQNRSPGDPEHE